MALIRGYRRLIFSSVLPARLEVLEQLKRIYSGEVEASGCLYPTRYELETFCLLRLLALKVNNSYFQVSQGERPQAALAPRLSRADLLRESFAR